MGFLASRTRVVDSAEFYAQYDIARSMAAEGKPLTSEGKFMDLVGTAGKEPVIPKGLNAAAKGASATLAVAGTGIGIWADMQDGESTGQVITPNVAATTAGVAVTSWATATATGALAGSVVPGVGTVVGGAVGLAAGVTASLFTDGFVDSLFEDHKGLWHAAGEGAKAVGDGFKSVGNASPTAGTRSSADSRRTSRGSSP